MKRMTANAGTALMIVLTAAMAACGGAGGGPAATAGNTEAAIVPGADLVGRIDVQAMRESSLYQALKAEEDKGVSNGFSAKLEQATGLTDADVSAFLFSMDIDAMDLSAKKPDPETASLALAVSLARPFPISKAKQTLEGLDDEKPLEITETTIGGRPALVVKETGSDKTTVYVATAKDDRTIYVTLNQASLEGVLARQAGLAEAVPDAIKQLDAAMAATSQARLVFVAPDSVRQKIQETLADPSAAMMQGFIAPFKDIQSISIGMGYGEGMSINLAGDLGDEQAANKANGTLSMMLPMVTGSLAKSTGKSANELNEALEITTEGAVLHITLKLSAEDVLKAARERKAKEAKP